jgi:Na+-transporting NADH:ubiquinone oxidoreductase subunit A
MDRLQPATRERFVQADRAVPIRIVDGLDIPIAGKPAQEISGGRDATAVALLGNDYVGLRPALQVEKGDRVKLGQTLFADRKHPDIRYTSPGSGVVTGINRGARRALLSIVVSLDGDDEEVFSCWPARDLPALRRDQVRDTLLASGQWTAFRTRPYGRVPDAGTQPHSIFVTAMDSEPLAARPEVVIQEHPADFTNGLTVLSHLTEGPVFVCKAPYADLPEAPSDRVCIVAFSGPHPSGLAGTHIHFLAPVGAKRTAWHLGYQDVIAIGKLFTTGRIWTERIVALAGPMVREPRLIRARLGADIEALTRGELAEGAARIISGSVLSGRAARQPENYLGRFHNQVSVIAEAEPGSDRASAEAADRGFSTYSLSVSRTPRKRRFSLTTALHGRPKAMVPFGQFEWVMPLDILPTQLLRALLVGDTDMAQALGCLELVEEDLALCSFVCPSKLNYGPLLREALEHIEREG